MGPEGTWAAEVMIPPAAVETTDPVTIARAISTRAAWFLTPPQGQRQHRPLGLGAFTSDSAASLITI
eukprot:11590663-Alexandrium_andersonii.AAC.1